MATYVMSDLHGMYDEFIEMLDLIRFSSDDTLYILGDIFDVGEFPIDIVNFIMRRKNIHLIMGNHETMFIDYIESGNHNIWYINGGNTTHKQILERGKKYELELYNYIKNLPLYAIVNNNILCHAGLYLPRNYKDLPLEQILNIQDAESLLWERYNIGQEKRIDGYNIICGHTPVQSITKDYSNVKILERNGTYYIDCGCYFNDNKGRLACLRLEDKKDFYI